MSIQAYVSDKPVRVGAAKFVRFLWILTVGVSFKKSCSLLYGASFFIYLFILVRGKIMFVQPSTLAVKDYKSMLFGMCP